jgi:CheY-like chemotaxis protein
MQPAPASIRLEGEDEVRERPVVLVVEDHPATQHVISAMLHMQGYQPVCTANGREALEWIKQALYTQQYPLVILLDLFMPVMDGSAFLTGLRAAWQTSVPLPPTILLTVDQGNHEALACTDVLQKPFHIKELLERMQRVCNNGQVRVALQDRPDENAKAGD